jgi:hypothetical protein
MATNRKDLLPHYYLACRVAEASKKLTLDEATFIGQMEDLLDIDCGFLEVWEMFKDCETDDQAIKLMKEFIF